MDFAGPQHIRIKSINEFTCEHFHNLFDNGYTNRYITTSNNQRTSKVTWNRCTDNISVQRDKNGISALVKQLVGRSCFRSLRQVSSRPTPMASRTLTTLPTRAC